MAVSRHLPQRSVLRNGDFLRLWAGQSISVFGTQITILAVPILAALTLKVSPFEFGLLTALEFLPFVFLSLPAGVWVDRLRRRPILIATDVLRALSLLSIAVAFALDVLTIWQLYAVVLVNGGLTVFFDVAYQSYLPSVVERDQLVEGNSRLELTRQASQRLGPGLAGVLIGAFTAPFAILIDAVSYAVSAIFVSTIRRPEAASVADGSAIDRPSMRREIGAGLRYVAGHPWLRALALTVAIGNLFGHVADSILILYLVTEREFSPVLIGLAFTLGSVGVIAGALIASPLTRALGVGRTLLVTTIGSSVAWLPIALASPELLFPALTLTIVALSFFSVPWSINALSLRQAITPGPLLGRTNATMRLVGWGTIPIGAVAGGLLGSVIGLHSTIWVGALGCVLEFVPVAVSSVRHVRVMPAAASDGAPEGAPA